MDPNNVVGAPRESWVWLAPDWSDYQEGDKAPAGKTGWTRVKVRETLYNDGRIVRNVLDAAGSPVSAEGTPAESPAAARALDPTPQYDKGQQQRFKDAQAQAGRADQEGDTRGPQTGPTREVFEGGQWVVRPNPVYQTPAAQQDDWHTEGRPDGQGGFDNSRPIMVRTVNGTRQTREPDDKELRSWQNSQQMTRNPGGKTDAEIAAEADKAKTQADADAARNKPQVVGGTLNTTSPQYAVVGPDGALTWAPNPNYQKPDPKPIPLAPNQRWVIWDNGDGTTRTEKNPNFQPPSKIDKDPSTGRWIEITEDENGKPIVRPVSSETIIKPGDLPVLQTKYGEVASGLGALAQDLNQRVAAGSMTPEERKEAWTAAYQQAQTQVTEINNILDNSKAIWTGEIQQRGQTLGETQSRRSYAQNIFQNAASTGMNIAQSAGPGHGAAIAGGVGALMNIGQKYAEGMGGFRESPEVGLPPALQQARGMGLPGFPQGPDAGVGTPVGAPGMAMPGGPVAGPPGGAAPPPVGGVAPPPLPPPSSGISNTTDRGGAPREYTPASATGAPGLSPVASLIGGQLQAGMGSAGAPVAAGGAGSWDAMGEAQAMAGDGADPAWAEAVRRAAGELNQPGGYAWDRFRQPASRFGS